LNSASELRRGRHKPSRHAGEDPRRVGDALRASLPEEEQGERPLVWTEQVVAAGVNNNERIALRRDAGRPAGPQQDRVVEVAPDVGERALDRIRGRVPEEHPLKTQRGEGVSVDT